jgi:hypothetical protein
LPPNLKYTPPLVQFPVETQLKFVRDFFKFTKNLFGAVMQAKILFVDEIDNSDSFGFTSNWKTVSYNLQTINSTTTSDFSKMIGEENKSISIDSAGRFIYIIAGSLDEKQMIMSFYDCGNDVQNAADFCKVAFDDKQFIDMFMSRFMELKETYDLNCNKFKLKVGIPAD